MNTHAIDGHLSIVEVGARPLATPWSDNLELANAGFPVEIPHYRKLTAAVGVKRKSAAPRDNRDPGSTSTARDSALLHAPLRLGLVGSEHNGYHGQRRSKQQTETEIEIEGSHPFYSFQVVVLQR